MPSLDIRSYMVVEELVVGIDHGSVPLGIGFGFYGEFQSIWDYVPDGIDWGSHTRVLITT